MTNPKYVDELFWGKKCEDVHEWVECFEMAIEVKGIDEHRLFKIDKLNLRRKSKEWYNKLGTLVTY
jgi:hypothetical protein